MRLRIPGMFRKPYASFSPSSQSDISSSISSANFFRLHGDNPDSRCNISISFSKTLNWLSWKEPVIRNVTSVPSFFARCSNVLRFVLPCPDRYSYSVERDISSSSENSDNVFPLSSLKALITEAIIFDISTKSSPFLHIKGECARYTEYLKLHPYRISGIEQQEKQELLLL